MKNTSPTKEQIGQIVALLVAEKVTFDEAQAFILAHRDRPSGKKRQSIEHTYDREGKYQSTIVRV